DALTDGVFAFAMTLLVLNLELPEDFAPKGPGDVLAVFHNLVEPLIAYVISFVVLAVCWLGRAETRNEPERASGGYAWLVLLHLFFITVVPFSTMVVGEHGSLWPAVWLYSGNM